MKVGDKVQYQGFEATIESILTEEGPYQYRLGLADGVVVVFSHPRHPGWGFQGTSEDWADSGIENSEAYLSWPSSFAD